MVKENTAATLISEKKKERKEKKGSGKRENLKSSKHNFAVLLITVIPLGYLILFNNVEEVYIQRLD